MPAAAPWPELERDGSVEGAGRLELVFGGATGGGAQGGAAGVLKGLGKATGEAKLGGTGSSSASRFRKKKRKVPATRGFIHATAPAMRMRTSARSTAASSCVASCVASRAEAALPRRQSTPPAEHCSNPHPQFVVL